MESFCVWGIPWLADQLHEMGIKLGIYEDIGTQTCQHYPGSQGYEVNIFFRLSPKHTFSKCWNSRRSFASFPLFEELDAQTFADWKVDYVKLDGCYADPTQLSTGYPKFGNALVGNTFSRKLLWNNESFKHEIFHLWVCEEVFFLMGRGRDFGVIVHISEWSLCAKIVCENKQNPCVWFFNILNRLNSQLYRNLYTLMAAFRSSWFYTMV